MFQSEDTGNIRVMQSGFIVFIHFLIGIEFQRRHPRHGTADAALVGLQLIQAG
jgi:hypothetical protein